MLKPGLPWRKLPFCQIRSFSTQSRLLRRIRSSRQQPSSASRFLVADLTDGLLDGSELQIPLGEHADPLRFDHGTDAPSTAGQSDKTEATTLASSSLEKARSIDPHRLIEFWDTSPPTPDQLSYAHEFFHQNPPSLHYSASRFLHIPFTDIPEVAFLGRSNVGKSSLLNALMVSKICRVAKKPGHTRTMNAFAIGKKGAKKEGFLNVLDMPGYGTGSADQWGQEILKYLKGRKELKRVFVLVDSTHWIKGSDATLLRMLAEAHIPHQVVLSKVDTLLFKKKIKAPLTVKRLEDRLALVEDALKTMVGTLKTQPKYGMTGKRTLPAFGQVIACSGEEKSFKHLGENKLGALGIDSLRWAVLQATGLAPREELVGKGRRKAIKRRERKDIGEVSIEVEEVS